MRRLAAPVLITLFFYIAAAVLVMNGKGLAPQDTGSGMQAKSGGAGDSGMGGSGSKGAAGDRAALLERLFPAPDTSRDGSALPLALVTTTAYFDRFPGYPAESWRLVGKTIASDFNGARAKVTAGDFNGDGDEDVAVLYDYGNATSRLWIIYSFGGAWLPALAWSSGPGGLNATTVALTSGDYDDNGRSDVAALTDYKDKNKAVKGYCWAYEAIQWAPTEGGPWRNVSTAKSPTGSGTGALYTDAFAGSRFFRAVTGNPPGSQVAKNLPLPAFPVTE